MTRAERFYRWLAWLMPRGLVAWCFIRVVAEASAGEYSGTEVPSITAMDALGAWDRGSR